MEQQGLIKNYQKMKTLSTLIIFFLYLQNVVQGQSYVKSFHGNDSAIYVTNTNVTSGLNFVYENAADTNKTIYYIENFKHSDLKNVPDKIILENAKICRGNYKSKVGDFIFSFDSKNEFIYFFHKANRSSMHDKNDYL